jgi:hypothetical protein
MAQAVDAADAQKHASSSFMDGIVNTTLDEIQKNRDRAMSANKLQMESNKKLLVQLVDRIVLAAIKEAASKGKTSTRTFVVTFAPTIPVTFSSVDTSSLTVESFYLVTTHAKDSLADVHPFFRTLLAADMIYFDWNMEDYIKGMEQYVLLYYKPTLCDALHVTSHKFSDRCTLHIKADWTYAVEQAKKRKLETPDTQNAVKRCYSSNVKVEE